MKPEVKRLCARFRSAAETKTRHVGFCGFCWSSQKVQNGKLVLHGYKRPGTGFTEGRCPGVGLNPYEISPKTAELGLSLYNSSLKKALEDLDKLETSPEELEVEDKRGIHKIRDLVDTQISKSKGYSREIVLEQITRLVRSSLESKIRALKVDIERYNKLLLDWKPTLLTTVEEVKKQELADKADKANQMRLVKEKKFSDIKGRLLKKLPRQFAELKAQETVFKTSGGNSERAAIDLYLVFSEVYDLVRGAVSKIEDLKLKNADGEVISLHDMCKRLEIDDMLDHLGFKENGKYTLTRQDLSQHQVKDSKWKPNWPGFKP